MKRSVTLLLLYTTAAAAHPIPGVGDFYSGVLHPFLALEHLLPMIALALLAGQQDRKAAIGVLVAFPVMLAAGAASAAVVPATSLVAMVNIASMVVLGILVAGNWHLPAWFLIGLAALLAFTHGLPEGTEISGSMSALPFVSGVAVAGLLAIAYGIGLGRSLRAPWTKIAVRMAGSWIAAAGVMVLGLKA